MDFDYKPLIISIVSLIVSIVFNRKLAEKIIKGQNRFWGFKFGEKQIKQAQFSLILVCALFFIFVLIIEFFVRR